MSLEEFHHEFRADLQSAIADRIDDEDSPFPQEELVFAEMVMQRVAEAGLCEEPVICHWNGLLDRARLRITGYALSMDETELDLFVTHWLGSETVQDLKDADAAATAQEGVRFLFRAARGGLDAQIDPTHPVRDLVAAIRARWEQLDRLRVFVVTDARTKAKRFTAHEVHGKMVSIEAMDIERLWRHVEARPRDEIALSLTQAIGHPLPCVHVPEALADYEYALAAIPGQVIRDLYLRHGARLMEANVRTFLGTKKAVNRGIIETLRHEPEHFLAYNNGLVLVCDSASFERAPDGSLGLAFLKGVQIVNGGQTTSSLYFGTREDRSIDLTHVMVPAKIIILKSNDQEAREKLISAVSRNANSQNAVKLSDLSANRSFHVQLEKLADSTWCPDGATRWFYERAAGAWNVMLLREGTTPAKRRKLRELVPPKRKLTKNDIARYHEAWRGRPAQVALGGEKNFAAFMQALDEDPGIVPDPLDSAWYRAMIAKVILFRAVEAMIRTKEARPIFRQSWVNVATYVTALAGTRLGDRIDLDQIWLKQGLSQPLKDLLWNWAVAVNGTFERLGPGQQISEVAKRAETWNRMRELDIGDTPGGIPELRG